MGQKLKVEKVDIFIVPMELKYPFTTSFGTEKKRRVVIVSLENGDLKGWGECTAGEGPWYSYETVDTAVHIAKEFLVPLVLKQEFNNPTEFYQRISVVRGNNMIKAAFVGFGEINSPRELIDAKCATALEQIRSLGFDVLTTETVTDDPRNVDVQRAIKDLSETEFDRRMSNWVEA